ncbi:hypothetical protein ATN88_24215 [Enterovibrio coralii]|uniref:Alpha-ketoglutarate-dependent dioxygenase AlkB-like domain-containing protein n=1 Tax=Enterovibrio coralii TaxID=294935 RepID=A0A135I9X8_9GAMM|nr:hypothetical protein ATN88_24215 [Enterovibrio coralii]
MQGDLFEEHGWINIPDGLLYWQPNFIQQDEADKLFALLSDSLPWQQLPITMFGKEVLQPRMQAWFGEAYTYSGLALTPAKMPPALVALKERCEDVAGIAFNSVLANLYRDGQDYMAGTKTMNLS